MLQNVYKLLSQTPNKYKIAVLPYNAPLEDDVVILASLENVRLIKTVKDDQTLFLSFDKLQIENIHEASVYTDDLIVLSSPTTTYRIERLYE